ncbi:5683_t:CDS:2 [Entrophospora sp. SA101]|nr:5683_t:CDS:2 [Entrophospora sp. SA101]CAJ0846379.1 8170_t:CDS:2 [Entrophospora sp. SA101]
MRPVPNVPREMIDEIIRKKKLELAARQITRLANLIGIYSGDDTSTTTAVTKNDKKKSTTLSKNKVNDNEDEHLNIRSSTQQKDQGFYEFTYLIEQ